MADKNDVLVYSDANTDGELPYILNKRCNYTIFTWGNVQDIDLEIGKESLLFYQFVRNIPFGPAHRPTVEKVFQWKRFCFVYIGKSTQDEFLSICAPFVHEYARQAYITALDNCTVLYGEIGTNRNVNIATVLISGRRGEKEFFSWLDNALIKNDAKFYKSIFDPVEYYSLICNGGYNFKLHNEHPRKKAKKVLTPLNAEIAIKCSASGVGDGFVTDDDGETYYVRVFPFNRVLSFPEKRQYIKTGEVKITHEEIEQCIQGLTGISKSGKIISSVPNNSTIQIENGELFDNED